MRRKPTEIVQNDRPRKLALLVLEYLAGRPQILEDCTLELYVYPLLYPMLLHDLTVQEERDSDPFR